jgi:hypothetical protein
MDSSAQFFHLDGERAAHDTTYLEADPVRRGDAPECRACGAVLGWLEWLPPFRVEIELHGKGGAGDFALTRDPLVSQRMADAFRDEKLTGLVGFDPVEIVKVRPHAARAQLPKYLRVQAVFGRAAVDEPRSRLRHPRKVTCRECRSGDGVDAIYGFRIEPGTWDGLDVFRPRGLQTRIVVSERFADFVKRHGFTNIELTPTEQLVWDPLRQGPPAPTVLA